MAAFQFRLAKLLRLRESERDERRGELAVALKAEQILTERDADLVRQLDELREQSQAANAEGTELNVDSLVHAHRHHVSLKLERQQIAQQSQEIAQEIERRREALVEADRQVKLLEKLREVRQRDFEFIEQRQEGRVLDDVGGQLWLREQQKP